MEAYFGSPIDCVRGSDRESTIELARKAVNEGVEELVVLGGDGIDNESSLHMLCLPYVDEYLRTLEESTWVRSL